MATLDAAVMIFLSGLVCGVLLPIAYPKLFERDTESEDE